jgi:sec-independent protein translocase protein TatB
LPTGRDAPNGCLIAGQVWFCHYPSRDAPVTLAWGSMFDFSWSEILLIGVVALVVIGPKDLPRVLRTVGQWANRARGVAREFQFHLDEMIRDSELDEVRKTMNAAVSTDIGTAVGNFIDPAREIEKSLSAPELYGEAAAPATPPVPATAEAEEPTQLALPTIGAPAKRATPEQAETALSEAKSGTHG